MRTGVLQRVIGIYKFQNVRAAYRILGDLVLAQIPELPPETVVVPLPTVPAHIRQRGYDHAALLAGHIAKKRKLRTEQPIARRTATKQRDASREQRISQAERAFAVKKTAAPVPHLLIDDVVTTGASIHYASQALLDAGASEVWVAVVARQPLD